MTFRALRPNPDKLSSLPRATLERRLALAVQVLDTLYHYIEDLELQDGPSPNRPNSPYALCCQWFGPAFDKHRFEEACMQGVHHKTALHRARRGV